MDSSERQTIRLVMLVGLGADARLVDAQKSLPFPISVLPWLLPDRGETIIEYARRMAERVDQGSPFVLCGISFGGMVAMEMTRHLSPNGVVLISSCKSSRSIPFLARRSGMLAPLVPARLIRVSKRLSRVAHRRFGITEPAHKKLFDDMLRETPPELLRWAVSQIVRWPGAPEPSVPVLQIHGEHDRIIPLSRVQPQVVIAGAGHLANVTHAREVNAAIAQWCQQRIS